MASVEKLLSSNVPRYGALSRLLPTPTTHPRLCVSGQHSALAFENDVGKENIAYAFSIMFLPVISRSHQTV